MAQKEIIEAEAESPEAYVKENGRYPGESIMYRCQMEIRRLLPVMEPEAW